MNGWYNVVHLLPGPGEGHCEVFVVLLTHTNLQDSVDNSELYFCHNTEKNDFTNMLYLYCAQE